MCLVKKNIGIGATKKHAWLFRPIVYFIKNPNLSQSTVRVQIPKKGIYGLGLNDFETRHSLIG